MTKKHIKTFFYVGKEKEKIPSLVDVEVFNYIKNVGWGAT